LNLSGNQRNGAEFSALAGATVKILDISGNGMAKLDLAEVKDMKTPKNYSGAMPAYACI